MEEKENIRIHYKSTIWTELRFKCTPEQKKQLLKDLENLGVDSIADENLGFDDSMSFLSDEILIDPSENNGCATVEVYNEDSKLIWDNKNK